MTGLKRLLTGSEDRRSRGENAQEKPPEKPGYQAAQGTLACLLQGGECYRLMKTWVLE